MKSQNLFFTIYKMHFLWIALITRICTHLLSHLLDECYWPMAIYSKTSLHFCFFENLMWYCGVSCFIFEHITSHILNQWIESIPPIIMIQHKIINQISSNRISQKRNPFAIPPYRGRCRRHCRRHRNIINRITSDGVYESS